MHLQDKRGADETRNWSNVSVQIEAKLVVERRVDCVRRNDREERIAIWGCTHDRFSSQVSAGARPVLDDELLTKPLREPLPYEA
jgi:hypothetical protein